MLEMCFVEELNQKEYIYICKIAIIFLKKRRQATSVRSDGKVIGKVVVLRRLKQLKIKEVYLHNCNFCGR